jgi:hypothetical protein
MGVAQSLHAFNGIRSTGLDLTLIRSIGLWHFDDQGAPLRQRSWASGYPANRLSGEAPNLPLPDISWCQRGVIAQQANAVVASWPFLGGNGDPVTLVVFELAPGAMDAVAVEHWAIDHSDDFSLVMRESWYTDAAMPMAPLSRHARMRLGFGLPGLAADLRSPIYLGNVSSSELFVRAYSASQVQLQHGLALPAPDGNGALVLLSDGQTPLAARLELAAVQDGGMRSVVGHCQRDGDLAAAERTPPWGAALLQACAFSAAPMLVTLGEESESAQAELQAAGATAMLALPFVRHNGLQVVLALWF